jgi:hypothetical protein
MNDNAYYIVPITIVIAVFLFILSLKIKYNLVSFNEVYFSVSIHQVHFRLNFNQKFGMESFKG